MRREDPPGRVISKGRAGGGPGTVPTTPGKISKNEGEFAFPSARVMTKSERRLPPAPRHHRATPVVARRLATRLGEARDGLASSRAMKRSCAVAAVALSSTALGFHFQTAQPLPLLRAGGASPGGRASALRRPAGSRRGVTLRRQLSEETCEIIIAKIMHAWRVFMKVRNRITDLLK